MDLNYPNHTNLYGPSLVSAAAPEPLSEINCVSSSSLVSDNHSDSSVTQKHLNIHQLLGPFPFGFKSNLGSRYCGAVSTTGQLLTNSPWRTDSSWLRGELCLTASCCHHQITKHAASAYSRLRIPNMKPAFTTCPGLSFVFMAVFPASVSSLRWPNDSAWDGSVSQFLLLIVSKPPFTPVSSTYQSAYRLNFGIL